ncbi:sigma 54-interacting transcriptional regulator [Hyphococcus sp.]|uniref:sigma 54-interacting transcriptional regulator n=1 Tax=Hyphococcus sp. TaxID=2038636 RepID=UPI0020870D0D|nr:MAG: hypothetical protein DHS20C04_23970 [Marinicaulis sp.]
MDDQEYDGASRSAGYEPPYSSGSYAHEAFVPSRAKNGVDRKHAPLNSNLIQLRPDAPLKSRISAPLPEIVGSSAQTELLRETIELFADDESPVFITGETGVGKELVARHLHAKSSRRQGAFSPLNAGAMPETLAAAELFGHAKGAFTGAVGERDGAIALADGGVMFLDEIGEMPLSIQTHLLRVLEDGMVTKVGGKTARHVDFRLISATNVDLRENVSSGQFRRDLFYRVNVLVIDVPPLRARGDDVVEIAEALIANHPDERYRKIKLTPKAADRLRAHSFPGNVRELRNVLSRALLYAHKDKGKIMPDQLRFDCDGSSVTFADNFDVDDAKNLINRYMLMKAMNAAGGNIAKAVALTGRSRGTFQTLKKSLKGEDFASAYQSVCAEVKALLKEC